ncbi:MAG: hypothetical protein ACPGR8_01165 [Limisphaerales bacterium]
MLHLTGGFIEFDTDATSILITIVKRDGAQFVPVGTARFTKASFADTAGTREQVPLRTVNGSQMIIVDTRETIEGPLSWVADKVGKKQVAQDAPGLYQTHVSPADGIENESLAWGHPWLKCGPWFAGGRPAASGLWKRYVGRALILTGYSGQWNTLTPTEMDLLLAVGLQGCTGVYDKERVDDRKPEDLYFGTNGDCDDQSVSVAALAEALLAEPCPPANDVASALHHHLQSQYSEAAIIVGLARSPTNPSAKPFGHSWAALLRGPGEFAAALHLEPTAPMTPLCRKDWSSVRWPKVLTSTEYNARSARCKEVMVKRGIHGNRLVGVRIAEPEYYGIPCTATTKTGQYHWPKTTQVPWLTMIRPGVTLEPPQLLPRPSGPDPDPLHHLPDRTKHIPINYNRLPKRTKLMQPKQWLGVAYAPLNKSASACKVVDSFCVLQFVPSPE